MSPTTTELRRQLKETKCQVDYLHWELARMDKLLELFYARIEELETRNRTLEIENQKLKG